MRALVTTAVAILLAHSGCAATVDVAYLIDNGRYTESTGESQLLPQTIDRVEYETAIEPDGSMRVACFARSRQLERTWQVIKTYRCAPSSTATEPSEAEDHQTQEPPAEPIP